MSATPTIDVVVGIETDGFDVDPDVIVRVHRRSGDTAPSGGGAGVSGGDTPGKAAAPPCSPAGPGGDAPGPGLVAAAEDLDPDLHYPIPHARGLRVGTRLPCDVVIPAGSEVDSLNGELVAALPGWWVES